MFAFIKGADAERFEFVCGCFLVEVEEASDLGDDFLSRELEPEVASPVQDGGPGV
jgi:hypothetical protein